MEMGGLADERDMIDAMHYVFFEESYSRSTTHTKITLASWAVGQERWSRQAKRPAEPYPGAHRLR
jgi:hypothetical protein